jgi:hypothetical protein
VEADQLELLELRRHGALLYLHQPLTEAPTPQPTSTPTPAEPDTKVEDKGEAKGGGLPEGAAGGASTWWAALADDGAPLLLAWDGKHIGGLLSLLHSTPVASTTDMTDVGVVWPGH